MVSFRSPHRTSTLFLLCMVWSVIWGLHLGLHMREGVGFERGGRGSDSKGRREGKVCALKPDWLDSASILT